jgi:hypothetical protein
MLKVVAGILIAVASMAGIYAMAATIATSMAGSFISDKTPRSTPLAKFAALKREL